MATKYSEEGFIESLIESGEIVDVYLANGIKMKGAILGSDIDVIFVGKNPSESDQKDDHPSMIYKSAISTVKPIK
jgi:RNA chaperone Hfq